MCGIFAGISNDILAELVSGLTMLEYRGYDSSGITTINNGKLKTAKMAGKFKELKHVIDQGSYDGTAGIGHVRWATHGSPTTVNAHPHGTDKVSIVHNGIIENYIALKADLQQQGYQFQSETDTEIVAKLLDCNLKDHTPADAAHKTLDALNGSYSLVCLFAEHDDLLIGSCNRTPLVVGLSEKGGEDVRVYLSSDINAFPEHVNKVVYLKDGDRIFVQGSSYNIFDAKRSPVTREIVDNQKSVLATKGEYSHYMIKEIREQPTIIKHIVDSYVDGQKFANLNIDWQSISRINIVACGSAYYAGLTGMYWIEELTGIPVSTEIASEYIYRKSPRTAGNKSDLVIVISQSGETLDTLEALKKAKSAGSTTLAVINVEHSTIAREADHVIPVFAGPEIGVASTKAFTAQLAVFAALSLHISKQLSTESPEVIDRCSDALKAIPGMIDEVISKEEQIIETAKAIQSSKSILYLGRGNLYPIALEGALKLKELSYIHAEGYPGGELKHGPISLIEDGFPVVSLIPPSKLGEKMFSNMQEIKARGGEIFSVSCMSEDTQHKALSKMHFELPKHDSFASPIIFSIYLQLLSFHTCKLLGNDPDQPRNLAKSVTVE